jgi:phosphoribosyl-AMP cyclohydrolase / phosphoribosyl-ATP pyrophosphohydrolase
MTLGESLEPKWNELGLTPAIVQDRRTLEVLMMAWMNDEAWQRTRETGWAHFWSRSRKKLWKKGESSGNTFRVTEIRLDCDKDTVLLFVDPSGPACHTGERSCFFQEVAYLTSQDEAAPTPSVNIMRELYQVIQDRKRYPREGSYTSKLFKDGVPQIAKKVGEESAEVIVAALGQGKERLAEETADLLYHALVLLASQDLDFADVERVLEKRRR